ncbi:MAG: 30S ribosomal protein S13 [Candidatus Pacearchaeota archaeon]
MARGKEKTKEIGQGFIRLLDTDIPVEKSVLIGLTKIKGISFSLAHAICNYLEIDKFKKLKDLSEEEIKKLQDIDKIINYLPPWLYNRRRDRETNKDLHLFGSKLDLTKEFDIRRLKKIKCYRGIRHSLGLPVRGQRTKSHFRKGATVGVQKEKSKKR